MLGGITVIELGHSVAAPFAGQILADLGATVIKVENPNGGDDARGWGPPFWPVEHGETGNSATAATFHSMNRNKSSLAVDIKDPEQLAALVQRIGNADVMIQNMRPGLVERFGLDAASLRARFPQLVYCNLSAFGQDGPMRSAPGYDPLVQAFSGIMAVTGNPGEPPIRVAPSIIDQGSGMWSVIGILTALLKRQQTNQGCTVDTSLFETGLSWMTQQLVNSQVSGKETQKVGSETPILAPYKAYATSDRPIMIAAGNDNLFAKLSAVLGAPEWASDARFVRNRDRVENRKALNALIQAVTETRPADHWVAAFDAVGVPCAAVNGVNEVLAHPQTAATGMLLETGARDIKLVGTPLKFDGARPALTSLAPKLNDAADA